MTGKYPFYPFSPGNGQLIRAFRGFLITVDDYTGQIIAIGIRWSNNRRISKAKGGRNKKNGSDNNQGTEMGTIKIKKTIPPIWGKGTVKIKTAAPARKRAVSPETLTDRISKEP
jgi:hypothetical protein